MPDEEGMVFRVSTGNAVSTGETWEEAKKWIEKAYEDGDTDFVWISLDQADAKVYPDDA